MKTAPYKFILLTLVLALVTSACATVPPQIRPTNPDAFVGKWERSWFSFTFRNSGAVEMTIESPGNDDFLPFSMTIYRSDGRPWIPEGRHGPLFQGKFKFENGELFLVSIDPSCFTKLSTSLHGDGNHLANKYFNSCSYSEGQSSFTRKK